MRLRSEAGQAAALTAVFMTVLLGSCAAVLDVGSWFREDRDTQRIADAAALAGAQALPESPGEAQALALEYADKNGGGLNANDIEFSRTFMDNDTIRTKVERQAPGFFARLFDIDSVTVGSKAKARAGVPAAAKWVAPIVVNERHPKLVCGCFGDENPTQIDLENLHRPGSGDAAGAFALLNLNRSDSGAPGAGSLASWMQEGFPGLMDPGVYRSAPSTLFNSSEMFDALEDRTDKIVLFPVCRASGADTCAIRRGGQNAEYTIIGWVAFHITSFDNRGSSGWIKGYFTGAVWEGALSPTSSTPDFGVRVIALID
jgi:putative Flp pilus-assembly TadE/G-like protein